jgi:alkylation response protein AidB-like acyl-CoA dehydrogenase
VVSSPASREIESQPGHRPGRRRVIKQGSCGGPSVNAGLSHNTLTPDEIALLRDSVRETVHSLFPGSPDENWPHAWTASWETLTQQGLWSTIEGPEGSLATAVVVVEELGRALYSGPACDTLAGTYVVNRLGDTNGTLSTAFVINGSPMVQVAPETRILVAADDGNLFVTSAAEVQTRDVPSLDVTRRIVRLNLGAQVSAVSTPDPTLAAYGRAARTLLYCADTLGCVEHVLERAAEYAMQRTTFGSRIGKYQAVAHRLVDHAVTAQQMRLLLGVAVKAFDGEDGDVPLLVAVAETFFAGRSTEIISDCIQLAGAIGFTWEFGHHFYLRRTAQNAALAAAFGRPQQRLAQEAQW